jgi:hypothetical protein
LLYDPRWQGMAGLPTRRKASSAPVDHPSNFPRGALAMRGQWRAVLFAACVALCFGASGARADEVPVVTGEHWTKSSSEMKKAYLIGIANMLQVETAYFGATPPSDAQSFVPRMVRGLRAQTLDTVRDTIDRWYATNPGRLQRPVLEIIWFEIVTPGLQKSN